MSLNFKNPEWANLKKELKTKKQCPRQVKNIT